jgi:hypothetical protein
MLFDRLRITGVALLVSALSLAAWKTARRQQESPDEGSVLPAAGLTIPVEIVEAGQAPKLREIRVGR